MNFSISENNRYFNHPYKRGYYGKRKIKITFYSLKMILNDTDQTEAIWKSRKVSLLKFDKRKLRRFLRKKQI